MNTNHKTKLPRTLFYLLTITLYLLIPSPSSAIDFGLIFDQSADIGSKASGTESGTEFNYNGIFIPRLSGLLGQQSGFFVSLGLNYETAPFGFVPELLRSDLNFRSGSMDLRLGRMQYSDPLGFIAVGLFDGIRFSTNTGFGRFSVGAWYTGLLYKGRANIEMTSGELELNASDLNYGNFFSTYFAPRRFLTALEWEHQGLGELVLANLAFLGQFDLSGASLNSQYFAAKLMIPAGFFIFNLGGCLEMLQFSGEFDTAFAGELGLALQGRSQRFALLGRFSSGQDDSTTAFLPLTTIAQGYILKPKLSGISLFSLDYSARFNRTFSLGLSSYYFIRTGSESYLHYGQDGCMLGAEIYGGLYWSPFSDLTVNFGGGAFLPALGNAAPNANSLWRLDLRVILSLL